MWNVINPIWSHGIDGFVVYLACFIVLWCVLVRVTGVPFVGKLRSMVVYEWLRLVAFIIICVLLSIKMMLWLL